MLILIKIENKKRIYVEKLKKIGKIYKNIKKIKNR